MIYYIIDRKVDKFRISGFTIIVTVAACDPFRAGIWVVRFVSICVSICYACAWIVHSVYVFRGSFCLRPLWLVCCLCLICSVYVFCGLSAVPMPRLYIPFASSMACSVYVLCDLSAIYAIYALSMFFVACLLCLYLGCLLCLYLL